MNGRNIILAAVIGSLIGWQAGRSRADEAKAPLDAAQKRAAAQRIFKFSGKPAPERAADTNERAPQDAKDSQPKDEKKKGGGGGEDMD